MNERPMTVDQVAERWQCDEQVVRRCCRNGTLKSFRVGKLLRIRPEWVEEFERCQVQIIGSDDCTDSLLSCGKRPADAAATALARAIQKKHAQLSENFPSDTASKILLDRIER